MCVWYQVVALDREREHGISGEIIILSTPNHTWKPLSKV